VQNRRQPAAARWNYSLSDLETQDAKMIRKTEQGNPTYPAEKARQGEIILKQPWQRAIFIAGLAAAVVLPFVLHYFAR